MTLIQKMLGHGGISITIAKYHCCSPNFLIQFNFCTSALLSAAEGQAFIVQQGTKGRYGWPQKVIPSPKSKA